MKIGKENFFIIENKIEQKLNERDKSIWSF